MTKELVKNTAIYIFGSFVAQGAIFLLWLILARILPPAEIGIYALSMFIIEFFSAISVFGLDCAITRFYYVKRSSLNSVSLGNCSRKRDLEMTSQEDISSVLSNSIAIFLISNLLSLFLFLATARFIPRLIPGLSDFLNKNLFLFSMIILFNSISGFAFVHYTALKKAILYLKLQLLKMALFFFFSLALVFRGFGIFGVFWAFLFSAISVSILFFFRERKRLCFKFVSPLIAKNILSYAFPLMLYATFGAVISYFGRILLDRYTNLATLGIYHFFLMLTLHINGLWGSFNQAWTPEIFSKISKNPGKAIEDVKFMTFFLSFCYLLIFLFLIIFGEIFLFRLIFKGAYLANIYVFYILLACPLFTVIYTVAYPLYYSENKTNRILFISLVLYGLNIFLTFFMVKFYGQVGAALSYFILSIITMMVYFFVFQKIAKIPKEIINWAILISVLMVLNIIIFLKTSLIILFLTFLVLGIAMTYKIGNLGKKKELIFELYHDVKRKIFSF